MRKLRPRDVRREVGGLGPYQSQQEVSATWPEAAGLQLLKCWGPSPQLWVRIPPSSFTGKNPVLAGPQFPHISDSEAVLTLSGGGEGRN